MSEGKKTFSVALRVRRTICEDAYVSVPFTNEVTKQKEDGTLGIDFEAFTAEAIRISKDKRVEWKLESCQTEMHPEQQPKPEDRKGFDAFYEFSN